MLSFLLVGWLVGWLPPLLMGSVRQADMFRLQVSDRHHVHMD